MKDLKGTKNPMYGRRHTPEAKEKMRQYRLGKPTTLGTKRPHMTGNNNPASRQEVRLKISESKRGSKNPNWKGGISPQNVIIRNSMEMRLWRQSVFERDGYTCIWCGAKNGNGKNITLHADHIKPFSLFPELRFAIDNGRTLCVECHKKTDSYGFKKINKKNESIFC